MKNFKFRTNISTFVSRKKCSSIFDSSDSLICGIYNCDEFRTILEFKLSPKLFNFHISRAELVIFISCVEIDTNIESFMLNISKNTEQCMHNQITFNTSPKFFQDSSFSKITNQLSNNYIRIDITNIVNYWFQKKCCKFGITLIGLAQSSLIYIDNKNKKPFLDLSTNDCSNNYHHENINFEESNLQHKNLSKQLLSCNAEEKAFGVFTSTNGELYRLNDCSYVKFDSESCILNTKLNITNEGIIFMKKGIYKIDYMVNCICDNFTTMSLNLDGIELDYTKTQIFSNESITTASTLVEVSKDNLILNLKISTSNALLLCTGNCANIVINKIN